MPADSLDTSPLTIEPKPTSILDWSTSSSRPDLTVYNFDDQEWRLSAACRGLPTDLFFPPSGVSGEPIRDVCFSCPVRLDCLEYALVAEEPAGWFGGHPFYARQRILKLLATHRQMDLETADAIVIKESLVRMRNRRSRAS